MQLGNFRPRYRKHFRGCVQLHRARTERDHRSRQRKIARFELLEITQHLGLGVVSVEDRVSEKFGRANCGLRNADWRLSQIVIGKIAHGCAAKDRHQELDIASRGRFVE